ncbi:hypothetical protein GOZ81_21410 [Agrobacterium vitis]|uniref:hypothetical protein n=1 Tax=Agrobacterium vitis TaxID=373 RepID=UPI0012E7D8AF|nr:hypothetical protein [Agrobacterium vitis]MVA73605.1 hypothetical protein [Agrobacterium vitis]
MMDSIDVEAVYGKWYFRCGTIHEKFIDFAAAAKMIDFYQVTLASKRSAMMKWTEILQTISAVGGAGAFVYGVGTWRRTSLGQKRIDLAVQTIVAFRKAEQAFHEIRLPFILNGEGMTRVSIPAEPDEDAKIGRLAYVAIERIQRRSEIFSEIDGLKVVFRVYFGENPAEFFQEVFSIRDQIQSSAIKLELLWKRRDEEFANDTEREEHLKQIHDAEAVFWEGFVEPDPLKPRIEQMIAQVEKFCRDIIEPAPNIRVAVKRFLRAQGNFWFG